VLSIFPTLASKLVTIPLDVQVSKMALSMIDVGGRSLSRKG
jgi:hypothetical protein